MNGDPPQRSYDWRACLIALAAAFAVAIPAGLLAFRMTGSGGLMVAVLTLSGTGVSQVVYRRISRQGGRALEDESCR